MKFSVKDFFSKCDQMRGKLRIWSHLLMKFLMENFTFCANQCSHLSYSFISMLFSILQHVLFLYPLKMSKKQRFFYVFRGYRNGKCCRILKSIKIREMFLQIGLHLELIVHFYSV